MSQAASISARESIGISVAVVFLALAIPGSLLVGDVEPLLWAILASALALGLAFAPRIARRF